ncbi:MAG: NAD(P)-dependent glycerol-3-phosphate dehydrogenase [bacterium]|nr:NAD(P)-dependent glycerol-3-phosphate dehydrogenase [bacterium]
MKINIAVLGAGSWGLTIAQMLYENGHHISIWEINERLAAQLSKSRKFKYIPAINLPKNIFISSDLETVVANADVAVIVVPSAFVRATARRLAKVTLKRGIIVVCATKGLEDKTFKTMSQVLADELPGQIRKNIAVLSGPNIANEIAARKPAAAVIASKNLKAAQTLQAVFMSRYFRTYTTTDVLGAELGGAVKNIIAIACGISDGMNLGTNAKSALITRGIAEMARLGKVFKAKPETFSGLSGLGDLITTCYSPFSRNRRCGELIAKGKTYKQAMKEICTVVEGINTCQAVYHFSRKSHISMPISEQVFKVLLKEKSPQKALLDLMGREAKQENSL